MKCQAIMNENMNTPQRKAMTVQINSTFSMGSFHQIRCLGGAMAILVPTHLASRLAASHFVKSSAPRSFGKRDGGDLHHTPKNVEDSRYGYADEQQQKRIIENPVHRWDGLG